MNEARVLLVNFHQLLICFVFHGRLGVRSHCNQVGHALKQTRFISCEQLDSFIPHNIDNRKVFVFVLQQHANMARTRKYLHRVNQALAECQRDDVKGKVANGGLSVQEGLQHLLQVNLHDRAAHAR